MHGIYVIFQLIGQWGENKIAEQYLPNNVFLQTVRVIKVSA
ncbi:hypothetical protein X474_04295 [Dethiosulfatarculus sandiegensis]|uniref:Uncharacterized protein n=1 Tax=Dethiosulfatarculus sandiegensis TaxID=1429043 RepID=A0A0D2K1C4_9BACT|nr:hypothetical protein X474_04295 [Dethiosulfatarculus sandiegensis]